MDKYHVQLLSRALRDLDEIFGYIAENLQAPEAALHLAEEIQRGICSLENMPHRCPERCRGAYAGKGYRQLLIKNYTIVFRIDEAKKQVLVVTVRYSRRLF